MELNRKQQIMYNEISNIISNNNGSSLNNRIFDYVNNLQSQLEQKDEQLNDIKEYVESSSLEVNTKDYGMITVCNSDDILNIIERSNSDD